jgi:hypothetical protein
MKLAFKRLGFGFTEKEVPISLKIGTLEDLCKELEIEFWQIGDVVKKNDFDFMSELLYQGYITACKESYTKPKYDRIKATIWNEHLSKESSKELMELMTALFGQITKMSQVDKKKAKRKQPSKTLEPSQ